MIDSLIIILQVLTALFIFFGIKVLTQWLFEKEDRWPPRMLNYRPWSCRLCFTFWLLLACFGVWWLLTKWTLTVVLGIMLTALDAIAQKVEQRNNTKSIYNEDEDF